MTLYRVKQFYWSLTCKIDDSDIEFVDKYLNYNEKILFNQLALYEKKHCINVARDVKIICNSYNYEDRDLIKAALLHDIGKIYIKLSVIDKSIMVILDKISKGKLRKFNYIGKVNAYYNHGEIGYDILKGYNYDDKFLYLIKNHHNNVNGIKELDILKYCDNKN